MKAIFVISTLLIASVAALNGSQTAFVKQPLNHFIHMEHDWEQRYFVNQDYFLSGGPIFIYVGKGFEFFEVMYRGEVYDMSKALNGIHFALEHRFYGASRPAPDVSYVSLEHMTIEQAVADIAEFIVYVKETYEGTENSKVILYGEEYGAALAVWARQKYPHLVDGVWASSAYVSPVINHVNMAVNLGDAFKRIGGQKCYDVLLYAFDVLELYVWMNDTETIQTSLKQCKPLDTEDNIEVNWLFLNLVQLIENYVKQASYQQIEMDCEKMVEDAENNHEFESFSNWLKNSVQPNVFCFNFNHKDNLDAYSKWEWETVGTAGGARQDWWVHCSQLGQFGSSEGVGHPFGKRFRLHMFLDFCEDLFPNERLKFENKKMYTTYGDKNLHATNVFFSNGEFDPKIALGVTEDLNGDSPSVVIPLHTAGKDIKAPSPSDNPVLKEAKFRAKLHILKWIFDLRTEEEAMKLLKEMY